MNLSVAFRKAFPGLALDVAFEAPAGVTAIYGPSGCGKSSTANAVAGLLRPDSGHIALNGRVLFDGATDLPPHRRRIGYVFQDVRLFPHLSVAGNLDYAARFGARPSPAERDRVIAMLGLGALLDRRPAGLSGGERQRTAIGRALLADPALLILDEPLAALDPARAGEILPHLAQLRAARDGPPILLISHAMAEIARLADHLVVMREGRVCHAGPLDAALADPEAAARIGIAEAGALLPARLAEHSADDLSRVETPAGDLWVPRLAAPPGARLRLRILAHEVLLAREAPPGLSALNTLRGCVTRLVPAGDRVLVQLRIGEALLLAAITARSAERLGLGPGTDCAAILKTVAMIRDEPPGLPRS